MFSSRLFWKLFVANAALTFVTAAAFAAILANRERHLVTDRIQRRLHDAAVHLREETAGEFSRPAGSARHEPALASDVQGFLHQLSEQTDMRLTLIADDGRVLGDSDEAPEKMNNHSDRPEVVQARREGVGVSRRLSPTLDIPMMYVAMRVGSAEAPAGFVRTSMPMQEVNQQVAEVQQLVWSTALAVGLAALVLTYVAVGRITRPLEALTKAASAIAEGNYDQRVALHGGDELGTLATAFNAMSGELAARVDELQQTSRQLAESSQRMATVLSGMIEGVIAVDAEQRILFVNRAAGEMLNLDGAVGRPLWESVRNPTFQRVVRDTLSGSDGSATDEIELPGEQAIVGLLGTRLPGDPCPGVVLVLHDVTELRRLENLRRDFVSNVSHELKTPLTAIRAYTETLLNGAIDDPDNNCEFLARIEQQSNRLGNLIQDLLWLARVESGRGVFDLTSVSLGRLVEECLRQHQPVAESKGVSLRTEPPETDVEVRADEEGVRTILDNLVDNAAKYTPEGGSVTVRWRREGQTAAIAVCDTGEGIPAKHLPRIFERFYRADKARSREMGGTGLGLSIVKHLVNAFGGSVDVQSRLGKGTTFSVRLPVSPQTGVPEC